MSSVLPKYLFIAILTSWSVLSFSQTADSVKRHQTDTIYVYDTVKVYQNVKKYVYVEGPPASYWSSGVQLSQEVNVFDSEVADEKYGFGNSFGWRVFHCGNKFLLETGIDINLTNHKIENSYSSLHTEVRDTVLPITDTDRWWAQMVDGVYTVYYLDSTETTYVKNAETETRFSNINKRVFLSVPLFAGYELKNGFWTFELKAGGIMQYMISSSKTNILYKTDMTPIAEGSYLRRTNYQLAGQFCMKYLYNLNTLLTFSFQYAAPLRSLNKSKSVVDLSYNTLALQFGISHIFE